MKHNRDITQRKPRTEKSPKWRKATQLQVLALYKISKFHLISWCENFEPTHNFRRVSGDVLEAPRKVWVSSNSPHQEINRDLGILCSASGNSFYSSAPSATLQKLTKMQNCKKWLLFLLSFYCSSENNENSFLRNFANEPRSYL